MQKKPFFYLYTKRLFLFLILIALSSLPNYGKEKTGISQIKVLPFKLSEVTLQESIFTFNRDKTIAYLKFLDVDRLLHNFRIAAGIPTKAKPCGGWEKPDCKLRGHSLGHYMLALAQAYASTTESTLKEKLDYIVIELGKCQDKLPGMGNPSGFLSAYSLEQFNKLEKLITYPSIWAPYYTLHKILAGLISAHQITGNEKALDIAKKIADWVYIQLRKIPDSRLQEMWNLYIAGEYGGMNETLAELFHITGNKNYIVAARKFDKKKLLYPSSKNQDILPGLHANQHIPQITGYLRVFDMVNDPLYYNAAKNFWQMVVGHHMYINGGVSEGEMFKDRDKIASFITNKTCETCCAYNMLKLTKQLFLHDPHPKYMDYYERALYNQILASQNPKSKHTSVTYFMPLNPGGEKSYSNDYDSFTCCHGTGMENHTKYQESIYFQSNDMNTLYVNLYIPSTLNWPAKGFRIIQDTRFPFEGNSKLIISGSGKLKIKLRVPYWVQKGFTVKINGRTQKLDITSGTFVTLDRDWEDKDVIAIDMPFTLRLERLPDIKSIAGIMAGPILLVGISDQKDWINLRLDPKNLNWDITPTSKPLEFITHGITLIPMFKGHNHRYHSYFIIIN